MDERQNRHVHGDGKHLPRDQLLVGTTGWRSCASAVAILMLSERVLAGDDLPIYGSIPNAGSPIDTAEVVQVLGDRPRHLSAAEISTLEKSRMTATVADTLLRAIGGRFCFTGTWSLRQGV